GELEGVPEKNLDLLRVYLDEVKRLQGKITGQQGAAAAPGPAAQAAPPPGGGGGAAPAPMAGALPPPPLAAARTPALMTLAHRPYSAPPRARPLGQRCAYRWVSTTPSKNAPISWRPCPPPLARLIATFALSGAWRPGPSKPPSGN